MTIFYVCSGRWSTSLWGPPLRVLSEREGFSSISSRQWKRTQSKPSRGRDGRCLINCPQINVVYPRGSVFAGRMINCFCYAGDACEKCCCLEPGSSHKPAVSADTRGSRA